MRFFMQYLKLQFKNRIKHEPKPTAHYSTFFKAF